ncbi:hypothetical protein JTB14_006382 [Gonioctena quinquepunctata]|nr:hypothetical protein JTB14_006382 [Gonioctena quinquepunctata]
MSRLIQEAERSFDQRTYTELSPKEIHFDRTPATWDLELSYLRSRRDRRRSLVISARRLANQAQLLFTSRAVSCCKGSGTLLQFKNPEGQVARWIERLQEFDLRSNIERNYHKNADALSRRPCPDDCSHCGEQRKATLCRTAAMDDNWNDSKIQKDQERDPTLA